MYDTIFNLKNFLIIYSNESGQEVMYMKEKILSESQ